MAQFAPQGRFKQLFTTDGNIGIATSFPCRRRPKSYHPQSGNTSVNKIGRFRRLRAKKDEHSIRIDRESNEELRSEIEEEDDEEFREDELSCFRGLVLDISYRPINVVCWKRAICLEFMEKADVLEYYEQTVSSPNGSFNIPAVLRVMKREMMEKLELTNTLLKVPHLLQMMKRRRVTISLSRKNIFYRDKYICQYCSSGENLTVDHVIPSVQGGPWTWENLVTACSKCNGAKGARTPDEANMALLKQPKAPSDYDILAIPLTLAALRMLRKRKGTPEEWRQYLSSDL